MKNHIDFWMYLAAYYRQELQREILEMYVHETKHVPLEKLAKAWEQYKSEDSFGKMPLPGRLVVLSNPQRSEDDLASELSSKIFQELRNFTINEGYKAKQHLGVLASKMIERFGDWETLSSLTNDQIPSVRAQLRDAIKAEVRASRAGIDTNQPTLDHSEKQDPRLGILLNSITKGIGHSD